MGKLQGTSGNSGPHSAPAIVYPVISRRSRGLSVGINLFTERKVCSFDCAYCEVFPFEPGPPFSLESMEKELRDLKQVMTGGEGTTKVSPMDVRDIAFSGNGEPTMHPQFLEALSLAGSLRDELFPEAALVLITNERDS